MGSTGATVGLSQPPPLQQQQQQQQPGTAGAGASQAAHGSQGTQPGLLSEEDLRGLPPALLAAYEEELAAQTLAAQQ